MRISLISMVAVCGALLFTGCTLTVTPPVARVVVADPVYYGPGVEVVDVEPAPALRVYCYDPGFPPGAYLYGGFYWYGGHRYERDVFMTHVVNVNIREHHFTNIEDNRRRSVEIEKTHRVEYAKRDIKPGTAPRTHALPARNEGDRRDDRRDEQR